MKILSRYRLDGIILCLILLLALGARMYKISSPLIEFHSWRQADTAAVARNFAREGMDLLHPRYDDISPQQSGLNNPNRYRMVEFPIYNAVVAMLYKLLPALSIVQWGRIASTIESLVIIVCIYLIARKESGVLSAVVGSLVFALYPFFVFYSRAILPEVFSIMCVMVAVTIAYFARSSLTRALALCFFAIALLAKPTAIFYLIALMPLMLRGVSLTTRSIFFRVLAVACSLVPLVLWRLHITQYPEGIPASAWLITSVSTGGGMYTVFFRPAFFRWIFYERLNVLILGSYSFILFVTGIIARTRSILPATLLLSSLAYLFTFQGGNVQHEYYQIMILPVVAIFVGLGAHQIVSSAKTMGHRAIAYGLIITALVAGVFISWDKVRHYYYSLSDIPKFATIVQSFTTRENRIVVDTAGDTTALYAFDRIGSPGIYADIATMKRDGNYSYLFTYNHETADSLEKEDPSITRIFQNDRFVLFKL